MIRALFSGSRDWTDVEAIRAVVDALPADAIVLHGAARGADMIVDHLAKARGLVIEPYEADWQKYDKEAGAIRNQEMLDRGQPTEGHAFPLATSKGTWDMVSRLRKAGIPIKVYGISAEAEQGALSRASLDVRASGMVSFDSETRKFRGGQMAPKVVCASTSEFSNGRLSGRLLPDATTANALFRALLTSRRPIVFANAAYDLAVMAAADPSLHVEIFRMLEEGRSHDVLLAEALSAIYHGHLGAMPDGRPLYNPATGKEVKRYSLALTVLLTLGRSDAKENDVWKLSYGLLEGLPFERWPEQARVYPIADADNTLGVGATQVTGLPGPHDWVEVPAIPGLPPPPAMCRHCGQSSARATAICPEAPRGEPHKNLGNLAAQMQADYALRLGACWGLRTDPERVEALAAEVEEKHKVAVERFQKKGWIREDGSEDTVAVKRAVAIAYGAGEKVCRRCGGGIDCSACSGEGVVDGVQCEECDGAGRLVGKIARTELIDCRGEKLRGRYRGCNGTACAVCGGTAKVSRPMKPATCKNVLDERDRVIEAGCDGTGLDLSEAKMLPRTDKLGVGTDRDAKMESGDDDLSDYGEDEFEKARTTYVPYLRTGVTGPLIIIPNCLVVTGRCSYEGCPLHQMPRQGKERSCIRARGAWCGSPIEYVLGSTDYEAGELCTLAQLTYWLFGYSKMRDIINSTGKPGILHSDLAAEVLGVSLDDFLIRLKAKDKTAVDFRQAMKPINFGTPGGMGTPKLVATNRKKGAGFTVTENGPAVNGKGQPGYWGIRFCVLTGGAKECGTKKIIEWKKRECKPACAACCDVVENTLRPAYFRRYPEVKDYFRWASTKLDRAKRDGVKVAAPCAVWNAKENAPEIIRERGIDPSEDGAYSALCNNGFQAMLADIGKEAYYLATKECYLGVKPDGSPSPLAGCRLPCYLHDEPLSELIRATAHLSGRRLGEIMVEVGMRRAPDITAWRAETALMDFWYKEAEPVYDANNNLVVWQPQARAA